MYTPFLKMPAVILWGLLLGGCSGLSEELPRHPTSMVPGRAPHQGNLKLVSINLAHGRKNAVNQLFLRRATIEKNLDDIAALLRELDADVVALQEADGPSRWSGGFSHVERLASRAQYPWYERASHARSWIFDYGTALLSRLPFEEVINHTFEPSPPTPNKGLLLGQLAWESPHGDHLLVDVISVHLDFSRSDVRDRQVKEMRLALGDRPNPVIVLGDFNSDWFSDGSVVRELAERSGLQVYQHSAKDLGTYRDGKKRFDWILISGELEFVDYRVLTEVVSDHRPVVTEIAIRSPGL